MNKLIAHAVAASLALFTLSDGPADKAAEAPAATPRAPDKGASPARPVEPAKAAPPARPAEPGRAAGTDKASAPARPAEPAKTVDPKPCEPIKPCAID